MGGGRIDPVGVRRNCHVELSGALSRPVCSGGSSCAARALSVSRAGPVRRTGTDGSVARSAVHGQFLPGSNRAVPQALSYGVSAAAAFLGCAAVDRVLCESGLRLLIAGLEKGRSKVPSEP